MDIVNLIGSVGFPILAYLLLFEYTKKRDDAFITAINNNTLAIQKLTKNAEGGENNAKND